uniref:CUB domain-containing protein n=1 Tax=Daphnia galeata TaxID=27404 RepID=A0A8J2RTP8_9CRUS|nr:unnamed protein product [Daphnia galeata]
MTKFIYLLLSVVLILLEANCASSVNSYLNPYRFNSYYPWPQWNYPSYFYNQPSARTPQNNEEIVVESDRQYPPTPPGLIQSCRSECTGERGNCFDPVTCTIAGGRASGTCLDGRVCCINVVNTCHSHRAWSSETTIINNTYWQSSLRPISPSSSCTLTTRQLCLTPCTVFTTQKAFSVSTASIISATNVTASFAPDVSQTGSLNCNNDFLVIPGGFNVGNPVSVPNMAFDRYCGERLNSLPGNNNSTTICTTATPFRLLYRTNRDETLTPTVDAALSNTVPPANGNRGFCLSFRVHCCNATDDVQDDEESEITNSHEIVDSFPSRSYDTAQYPWRLWNFPYYQPRIPQNLAGSPPEADPRFVSNRCNSRHSYTPTTTYPCYTSFITSIYTLTTTTTVTTTEYFSTTPGTTPSTTSTGTTFTDTTSTTPATTTTDSSASSAWCSDDGDNADLKVARKIPSSNSYYSNYNPYSAWRPWNVPYYQQYYQPSARIPQAAPTPSLSPAVPTVESNYVDFGLTSCRSDCSHERGNCLDSNLCSISGGRASGSCINGLVCCVSVVNTCHSHKSHQSGEGLVILNNTYWQSSLRPIEPSSSCTLTRQLCLTPCQVVTTQKPFSISTSSNQATTPPAAAAGLVFDVSQLGSLNCNNDYLVIPGGFNVANPPAVINMAFDRYCGERFNALPGNGNSTTVCTTATPFRLLYRTNRDETMTSPTADALIGQIPANGNRGFCLNFKV